MTQDILKYLQPNAAVPIDMETTAMLVNALRQAIAELESQEPICPECKAEVLYECVACSSNNYPPQRTEQEPQIAFNAEVVGYVAPQRTWVGLTPEEILEMFDDQNVYGSKWLEFARAIEDKLKERNT